MPDFDPYHTWLGIPPEEQPADHYRLLGIQRFEASPDVIANAADQRMAYLKTFQARERSADSQRLLNEVAAARVCLLATEKKAEYDRQLRASEAAETPPATSADSGGSGCGKTSHGSSTSALRRATAIDEESQSSGQSPSAGDPESIDDKLGALFDAVKAVSKAAGPLESAKGLTLVARAKGRARLSRLPRLRLAAFGVLALLAVVGVLVLALGGPEPATLVFPWEFEEGMTLSVDAHEIPLPAEGPREFKEGMTFPAEGPLEYECLPGRRQICATRPGYRTFLTEVSAAAGERTQVSVSWQHEATVALLWPVDERQGATLKVDGHPCDWKAQAIETTPAGITLPMTAGQHTIGIAREGHEPFQSTLSLTTGERRELATKWVPLRPRDGRGLLGEYFAGENFDRKVLTRYDRKLYFCWEPSPDARVPGDHFSARWSGWLKPPEAGLYTLVVHVDDGVRLWLDEKLLIDSWKNQANARHEAPIELTDQPHPIKIEYYEADLWAHLYFCWACPGHFAEQPVLPDALFCDKVAAQVASPRPIRNRIREDARPFSGTWVKGEPVDLLPLIDLQRDIVHGPWWFQGDLQHVALSSGFGRDPVIQLPVIPPEEYELELVAERHDGNDCIWLSLPVRGRAVGVLLDGWPRDGFRSGIDFLDGLSASDSRNETRHCGPVFTNGETAIVRYVVRKERLTVTRNAETIIDWPADYQRCTLPFRNALRLPESHLNVRVLNSVYRISRIRLTPLTSETQSPDVTASGQMVAAVPAPATSAPAEKRRPIPSAADQAATLRLLDETYHPERMTTAARKVELAKRLLELADKSGDSVTEHFVLLRKAAELAKAGGDAGMMLAAVDAMGREFDIALLNVKGQLLVQFAQEGTEVDAVRSLVEHVPAVLDEALAVGRPEAANAIIDAAYNMAVRLRTTPYRLSLHAQRQRVLAIYEPWLRCRQAEATLQKNPDNPEANLAVGRYRCLVEGKWQEGLPLLAKPEAPALQVSLADAWWDAARAESAEVRASLQRRAGEWYQRAMPQIASVVVKDKCQNRLAELRDVVVTPRAADALAARPTPGRRSSDVARLPREFSIDLPGGVTMEFVLIPAGEFLMGSSDPERQIAMAQETEGWARERIPTEGPQHRVKITRPFYFGKYEVTQGQWQAVMGSNPSQFQDLTKPVEKVSWDDAQAFLGKLSAVTLPSAADGRTARPARTPSATPTFGASPMRFALPTEAQWEYACRAGTTEAFSFGETAALLNEYGWSNANAGGTTHPVGQGKPNPWGLFDMHGNVWEWCSDWHGADYYAQSPPVDPAGPREGSNRVLRGGCWSDPPGHSRAAFRNSLPPNRRFGGHGFRAVLLVPVDAPLAAVNRERTSEDARVDEPPSSAPDGENLVWLQVASRGNYCVGIHGVSPMVKEFEDAHLLRLHPSRNGLVRLESAKKPGAFLCVTAKGEIEFLERGKDPASVFRIQPTPIHPDPRLFCLESVAKPGHFVWHNEGIVSLASLDMKAKAVAATFCFKAKTPATSRRNATPARPGSPTRLSLASMTPVYTRVGFDNYTPHVGTMPVDFDGQKVLTYIYLHAEAEAVFVVPQHARKFEAIGHVTEAGSNGVNFKVYCDAAAVYDSGCVRKENPKLMSIAIPENTNLMKIEVGCCGSGFCDHSHLLEPCFIATGKP